MPRWLVVRDAFCMKELSPVQLRRIKTDAKVENAQAINRTPDYY